jgi:hypothetical protein
MKMSKMTNEEIYDEVIDELYHQYCSEHDMDIMRHIHPMFRNGSFSEDYPIPEKPEPLMSKEEFSNNIEDDEKWGLAFDVLVSYIYKKENKL